MFVEDFAEALIYFMNKKIKEPFINIGVGKDFTIEWYAKYIMKKLGVKLKISYEKKLLKEIYKKKIEQVSIFEIEDKNFEKKILSTLKKANVTVNILKTPMFLTSREDFSKHLKKVKKPFFYFKYIQFH